jgi:hypothetical protein
VLELVFDGEFGLPLAVFGTIFIRGTAEVAYVEIIHEFHLKKWCLDLLRDAFSSESFAHAGCTAKEDDESTT